MQAVNVNQCFWLLPHILKSREKTFFWCRDVRCLLAQSGLCQLQCSPITSRASSRGTQGLITFSLSKFFGCVGLQDYITRFQFLINIFLPWQTNSFGSWLCVYVREYIRCVCPYDRLWQLQLSRRFHNTCICIVLGTTNVINFVLRWQNALKIIYVYHY